jgi:peroxiredoxin
MKFAKEADIAYPLLSDADLRVALNYGVAMKGEDIAVPSVFIVLPDRRIFWKHVGESVADRPSDQDLIAKVDQAIAASTAK